MCPKCLNKAVKLFGKTAVGTQRFKCLNCNKTFVWKRKDVKIYKEKHWFELWIKEGYSIRQISQQSGFSQSKLKRIKNYWLSKEPTNFLYEDYKNIKYLLFDGTYFKKSGCFIVLRDRATKRICYCQYVKNEGYRTGKPAFEQLKSLGLNPKAITTDGNRYIIKALKEVWSKIKIQRCLVHIMRESCRILRRNPKTQAARELKNIIVDCSRIKNFNDQNAFNIKTQVWHKTYDKWLYGLNKTNQDFKDITEVLKTIDGAFANMFHFLKDKNIASSTNEMEGFFGDLKPKYKQHKGLTKKHKISYLTWYCYYKNQQK